MYLFQRQAQEHGELVKHLHDVVVRVRSLLRDPNGIDETQLKRVKTDLEYLKVFSKSRNINDAERRYINADASAWRAQ